MKDPLALVSIILPAYNAEPFIAEAILSVLKQTYKNWELIIVDDGSTDLTFNVAQSFIDSRIVLLNQKNGGVSKARNAALNVMKGEFFCFVDADDLLPPNCIDEQVRFMLEHPEVSILGGFVPVMNYDLSKTIRVFKPSFKGQPFHELIQIKSSCFMGITAFVRKENGVVYQFDETIKHGEDLWFYITIANQTKGLYDYITTNTYICRQTSGSAMSNLLGLDNGYKQLYQRISQLGKMSFLGLFALKLKILKIMFLSYLKKGELLNAIRSAIKNLAS